MKIRVSLYLSYNETEINCKGFICPLSYANKVGDISYLEPMHATIPCVVHLHIKKYVSLGFKFIDPSFNTSFIKPLFILTAEVYFQDIEHMQGFWEIFHFDLHNFHYSHFDKKPRWVDKLDIQLQNGEILKSTFLNSS